MNRVVLAILGVILAVTVIVVIARESSGEKAPPPPKPARVAATAAPDAALGEPDAIEPDELDIQVRQLSFGDGSANQRSIRLDGANVDLATRLRDWLEPRESAAVASRSALDCRAHLAKADIVSVICATMPAGEPDAGGGLDASASARFESITLRAANGQVKELSLADVLVAEAGQGDVIAACKKTADTPAPCVWPPTAFAVGPEGDLFLCHDSHCVNMEHQPFLRPELR